MKWICELLKLYEGRPYHIKMEV